MRSFYKHLLFSFFYITTSICTAQDVNLSQFYELPLLRNPALAGLFGGDVRVVAAYRNQWRSVTSSYQTKALSAEMKFSAGQNSFDFFTLGLQLSNDLAGESKLSKTQIMPAINFHKSINGNEDSYFSAGLMAGPVQHSFDASNLNFDDQFVNGNYKASNPTMQSITSSNLTYWDVAAGISYSSVLADNVHYYVGLGLFHITKPTVGFMPSNDVQLNRKVVLNVGVTMPTGIEEDKIIMYADYFAQGGVKQLQGGFLYNHDMIVYEENEKVAIAGGIFYRWNDAIIPVVKLNYYHLDIGISYDLNVSKLAVASGVRGGMELTLSYKNYLNVKNSSINKTRCPVF